MYRTRDPNGEMFPSSRVDRMDDRLAEQKGTWDIIDVER